MWSASGTDEPSQLTCYVNIVKTEVLNMSEVDSVISDIEVSTSVEHTVNDSYDGDNDDDDNNNDVPQSARVLREGTRTLSATRPLSQPMCSARSPRYKPVKHSEEINNVLKFGLKCKKWSRNFFTC